MLALLTLLFFSSFVFFATRNHRRLYHRVRRVVDDLMVVVAPSWTPPRIGALLRAAVRQITSILRAGSHSPSVCRSPVPLSGMKREGGRDRPWTRASPLRPASKKTGSSKLPRASHHTMLAVAYSNVARTPEARLCRGKTPFRQRASRWVMAPPMGYYLQRAFYFRSLPSDDDAASTFISMTSDDGTCIVKVFLPVSRKDN